MFNNPPAKFLDYNEKVVYKSKTSLVWNIIYIIFCYSCIHPKSFFILAFQNMKTIPDTLISLLVLIICLFIFIYSVFSLIDVMTKRFWITNKNLILTYFFKTYKIPLSEIVTISYLDPANYFPLFRIFVSLLVIQTKQGKVFTILGTTCNDIKSYFKDLKKTDKEKHKEIFYNKMLKTKYKKLKRLNRN